MWRMTARRHILAIASLAPLGAGAPIAAAPTAADPWALLAQDGAVVLFRHALAPGTGDPSGFKPNDCATQRNLNDEGRAQARALGDAFARRGVRVGRVLHSQWCRTRETAELAFKRFATPQPEPAFNSFFQDRSRQDAQTAAARRILEAWTGPGVLVVVTHQVNISAIAGEFTGVAEGVVMRRGGKELVVVARLPNSF
jgi:broad specificity phosphatase PhoE